MRDSNLKCWRWEEAETQPVAMQANTATLQHPLPLIFTVGLSGWPAMNAQIPVWCSMGIWCCNRAEKQMWFFFSFLSKAGSKQSTFPLWERWWMDSMYPHKCFCVCVGVGFFMCSFFSQCRENHLPLDSCCQGDLQLYVHLLLCSLLCSKTGTGLTVQVRYCRVCVCHWL